MRYRAADAKADLTLSCWAPQCPSNAMAALAVALEAGVDRMRPPRRSPSLTAGDKRGELIEIIGATILNDSYNSNPEALRSMIRTLAARPAERRILVAGEMLELGEQAPELHAACGQSRRRSRPRSGRAACAAMRSTWPPRRAGAAWLRCFCPMPKRPVNGSPRIFAPAMWCSSRDRAGFTWSARLMY